MSFKKVIEWTQRERSLLILIGIVVLLRGLTLGVPALTDPSEARYATVAQRMVQSGQWLVPEINRGDGFEPFWGKPPLHFWLTACAFKVFGVNEFASRLPSFFGAIVVAWLVCSLGQALHSRRVGLVAALCLLSSVTFLVIAGASMTDMTLTCCTTGAVVSFVMAVGRGHSDVRWGLSMFVFLGLGMLVKGPIALIFPGASLFCWLVLTNRLGLIRRLPWCRGILLFLFITLPWFLLAEQQTPGLNRYFFVNENLLRFISKDYHDRYGSAHPIFRGAIWLFLLAGFLPWSAIILARAKSFISFVRLAVERRIQDSHAQFILLALSWVLIPICFFTVARSVLFTYILPAIPGCAMLFALFISRQSDESPGARQARWQWIPTAAISFVMLFSIALLSSSSIVATKLSTRNVVRALQGTRVQPRITFIKKLPYSALFYAFNSDGAPVSVSLSDEGDEAKISAGVIAVPKNRAENTRSRLPSFKDSYFLDGWQIFDLDQCGTQTCQPK